MSRVAFIWQGPYGPILIERLAQAGHDIVYLEKPGQKTAESSPEAGRAARNMEDALAKAEVVITLLDTPQEVEEIYLGGGGIFEQALAEACFIDLTTSSPRLAKELQALAAVHDHPFVEAPFEMSEASFWGDHPLGMPDASKDQASKLVPLRVFAGGEADHLAIAAPLLHDLAPEVIECGLPGTGNSVRLASLISVAGALMGLVEATSFAALSGIDRDLILPILNAGSCGSAVASYFGKHIIDEEFYYGSDLRQFFNNLTVALDVADELDLVLPGLETAHQLYDLLVLVGGGDKGIHALALLYTDEAHATEHGLNWELAQRAIDVYEHTIDDYDDEYYDEDDDCDDPECSIHHHHYHEDEDDQPYPMGGFFSEN